MVLSWPRRCHRGKGSPYINSAYKSDLQGGQRILRAVSRVTQSHSHGTPVVLGYIEEGPPKTDFKKMNRSNNSREEGEKEVEMSY